MAYEKPVLIDNDIAEPGAVGVATVLALAITNVITYINVYNAANVLSLVNGITDVAVATNVYATISSK